MNLVGVVMGEPVLAVEPRSTQTHSLALNLLDPREQLMLLATAVFLGHQAKMSWSMGHRAHRVNPGVRPVDEDARPPKVKLPPPHRVK